MATKIRRLEMLTADLASRTRPPQPEEIQKAEHIAGEESPRQFPPAMPPAGAQRPPKTGPGQMLQFRTQMLSSEGEINALKEQLKQFDGAYPTSSLDPKVIHRSKWANRLQDSFKTADFAALKADIEHAGGNTQPILVRPMKGREGHYEIVFGHRRHQACLELGLPILAVIWQGEMSDSALFISMDRENRNRKDLSPYEQGKMYQQALEGGLFSSARQLADGLGVSNAWVSKTMSVAQLLPPVLEAFSSPLVIQPQQAREINAAVEKDKRAVLKRAEKIRDEKLKPAAVAFYLVHGKRQGEEGVKGSLVVSGQDVGKFKQSRDGSATFSLSATAATNTAVDDLVTAFRAALDEIRSRS